MTLKIDLDSRDESRRFATALMILVEDDLLPSPLRCVELRKTRRGHHAYVVLTDSMGEHEKIAYQLLLASDRRREVMTLQKLKEGLRLHDVSVLYGNKGGWKEQTLWTWYHEEGLQKLFGRLERLKGAGIHEAKSRRTHRIDRAQRGR